MNEMKPQQSNPKPVRGLCFTHISNSMSPVRLQLVGSLHARHVSPITLMSVAGCSALSLGKEALVAGSAGMWGCKSNGVVSCVHGPHMGSLLTLPRHSNWACKVLNGQKQSTADSVKSNAELRRPHSGHWDRRSNGWRGREFVSCANIVAGRTV